MMSVRVSALRTTPRMARRPVHTINKATLRYRQLMERWDDERFAERKRRQAESSAERRRAMCEASRVAASRAQIERQRARRASNKRPTWQQACATLEKLAAHVVVPRAKCAAANNSALKYGTLRAPLVADMVARLGIARGRRFVDAGSGLGLVCLLIALTTGADVFGVEIRRDLHLLALRIGAQLARVCQKNGWLGVGRWTFLCGDARTILCDESIATVCDDERAVVVVVVGASSHPRCLYAWADLLLMNNWAFDDALSNDLLGAYARLAPIGGAAQSGAAPSAWQR